MGKIIKNGIDYSGNTIGGGSDEYAPKMIDLEVTDSDPLLLLFEVPDATKSYKFDYQGKFRYAPGQNYVNYFFSLILPIDLLEDDVIDGIQFVFYAFGFGNAIGNVRIAHSQSTTDSDDWKEKWVLSVSFNIAGEAYEPSSKAVLTKIRE